MPLNVVRVLSLALACAALAYTALLMHGCGDGEAERFSEELRRREDSHAEDTRKLDRRIRSTEEALEAAESDLYIALAVAFSAAAAALAFALLLVRAERRRKVLERLFLRKRRREDDA